MQEKELRKMSRAELIDIIYALQQNEKVLRTENEDLKKRLGDSRIEKEDMGSIAEAAARLNRIFEDAERAAAERMDAARKVEKENEIKAAEILEEARVQACRLRHFAWQCGE